MLLGELVNGTVTAIVNEETPESTWRIYPNPATSVVTIGNAQGPVRVYDALGRVVWTATSSGSLRIDIATWQRGVYLVHANSTVRMLSIL